MIAIAHVRENASISEKPKNENALISGKKQNGAFWGTKKAKI